MISAFDSRVVLTGCASENEFIRLPCTVIEKVERLDGLSRNTSGIRLRMKTNTTKLRIVAKNGQLSQYTHMPISGRSGFDVYVNNRFLNNVRPAFDSIEIDETLEIQTEEKFNIIDVYFPLYNSVVEFGFEIDKTVTFDTVTEPLRPILFYGSSITQGGCASRPGNSYVNMLSSMLGRNIINLGFSGNARGDIPVAEYIASLDIEALVYDYDHNAPDTGFLKETHETFFKYIRDKRPDLPVLMMSRPGYEKWIDIAAANTKVVMTTYLNALESGDNNVYFIDGKTLFGALYRDRCTIDGTHPNDIGFERMAESVYPVLKEILEGK